MIALLIIFGYLYFGHASPVFVAEMVDHLVDTELGSVHSTAESVVTQDEFGPNLYSRQPYVANGYLGARIPNLGQGFAYDGSNSNDDGTNPGPDSNGWPLFNPRYAGAFIAGFFNLQPDTPGNNFPELTANGWESVIAAIPQWTEFPVHVDLDGTEYILDSAGAGPGSAHHGSISHYNQQLSFENGTVTTRFLWLTRFFVTYTVFAHRERVQLGVVAVEVEDVSESTATPARVWVEDRLNFTTSQRCELISVVAERDGIGITFRPQNVDSPGAIFSVVETGTSVEDSVEDSGETFTDSAGIRRIFPLNLAPGRTARATKYVGISSNDLDPHHDPLDVARDVALTALHHDTTAPGSVIDSHHREWFRVLGHASVEFPGAPDLDLAARASLFHLAANTRPGATGVTAAVGVGGLSSDSYGGMVFWDTDLWMLRGMVPFLPRHAASLVEYRAATHRQAVLNALGDGTETTSPGAVYPWTSGRYGNCTATGPCFDYEYHINVAVALAAWTVYLAHGDDHYLRTVVDPLVTDAAVFFASYVDSLDRGLDLGPFYTHNLTDPDEFANHIDNGAYTNAAIAVLMDVAVAVARHMHRPIDPRFTAMAGKMYLPTAAAEGRPSPNSRDIVLEYSEFAASTEVKQADVILLTPLNSSLISVDQSRANLAFYARKQVSTGPAMTFPMFSAVAAAVATSGCASQSYLFKSAAPYLRSFGQILEQNNDNYHENGGTHPAFPFLTAHGGFLQAALNLLGVTYGYQVEGDDENGTISRYLQVDPVATPLLPGGVVVRGFQYLNNSVDMVIEGDEFVIYHRGGVDGRDEYKEMGYKTDEVYKKDQVYKDNEVYKKDEVHKPNEIHKTDQVYKPNEIHKFIPNPIPINVPMRNPNGGNYTLYPYQSLRLPVYKPTTTKFNCGNTKITALSPGIDGDVAALINDGDTSTRWQAKDSTLTATLDLDLGRKTILQGATLNWGDRPPRWVSLAALDLESPKTPDDFFTILHENITISHPFDWDQFTAIKVPDSNTTDLHFTTNCRHLHLQFGSVYDHTTGGAKVYEITLK